MQPLGALSDHLTKLQLQKNLSLYQNLLSNTCNAWSLSRFSKFRVQSSGCCRFLQKRASISPVPSRRLAPRPRPLVPAPHECLASCGRRRRAAEGAPPRDRCRRRLLRAPAGDTAPTTPPSAAQTTGARRVAFHSPERAAALVVNRRAWSALSAAVEPVRSPHRGQTPLRQGQLRLAAKRVP